MLKLCHESRDIKRKHRSFRDSVSSKFDRWMISGDTAVRLYIIFGVPHAWNVRTELIPVLLHLVKLIYPFTRGELSNFKRF